MQATNSTVEILLVVNDRAASAFIERNLALIESDRLRLTKIPNDNKIYDFIYNYHPALILYVFTGKERDSLATLSRIEQANCKHVPTIFLIEESSDAKTFLPAIQNDYLLLSEITPALLKKSIFWALERQKYDREISSVEQKNAELSSQLRSTKNLFQTIVDSTSTLVWMCDKAGNTTFLNQAWSRILWQANNADLDSSWLVNIHPLDLEYCQRHFERALDKQEGFTISYRLITFDANYRWISNYAVPQFTVSGEFKGLVGYCFDITSHKITEQKLIKRAASDRLLAQITQKIHTSLDLEQILQTTVDEVKQFLMAEKIQIDGVDEANQLTLLFESRLVGSPLSCDISEPKQIPSVLFARNLDLLSAGKSVTQDFCELANAAKSCSTLLIPIIVEVKLWGLICVENCSFARKWSIEEIYLLERVAMVLSVAIKQANLYQQLERANRELQQLSLVDGLTQIANRRRFDRYIASQWKELSREQSPLSLIFCDIDRFKLYNDTYGHPTGDRCLAAVAQAISKVVKRPGDLVCRYGGEEFVLVLPRTPLEGAMYLAQQIRLQVKALKIPHLKFAVDLYVTISLGVSCCIPRPDLDPQTLIAAADKALYQAKATGRDRAVQCEIENVRSS